MDNDDVTDPGLRGLSAEFQAMVGGMDGHAASFQKIVERRSKIKEDAAKQKDDEVYIDSYAEIGIHEEMLRDAPRVEAYRAAIELHGKEWRKSATPVSVVDVGSGTGLLAVLCAKAGAHTAHAVEASRLAPLIERVAAANGVGDAVKVHHRLAEELDLGGEDERVDVVVSEWMGYFLFFENMLPSVLAVRDKYLKPGGLMLPSACRLLVAPLSDPAWRKEKIGFWRNAAGLDMSALVPLATATACERPQHRLVDKSGLLSPAATLASLDLHDASDKDLNRFEAEVEFKLPADSCVDGFATWFECDFGSADAEPLSTAPDKPPTHWKQTVFYLRRPLDAGPGITLRGTVVAERHEEYTRGYRVTFDLSAKGTKPLLETFELR